MVPSGPLLLEKVAWPDAQGRQVLRGWEFSDLQELSGGHRRAEAVRSKRALSASSIYFIFFFPLLPKFPLLGLHPFVVCVLVWLLMAVNSLA